MPLPSILLTLRACASGGRTPSIDRQNRNIHGNIFGGFLMRQAFELAHVTCGASAGTTRCGKHMRLLNMCLTHTRIFAHT
jgi:hypothetical protein